MATLTVTKDYLDGTDLFAADLDAIVDSLELFFNTTKVNDDNIQEGSITSGILGSAIIATARIQDNAVTEDKIAVGAINTAKINDEAITAAKIEDESLTDEKIAEDAITAAKLDLTAVVETGFESAIAATTTLFSQSFTTSGNPVVFSLDRSPSAVEADATQVSTSTDSGSPLIEIPRTFCSMELTLKRDGVEVDSALFSLSRLLTSNVSIISPMSHMFNLIDKDPPAGTYTYTIDLSAPTNYPFGPSFTFDLVGDINANRLQYHIFEIY
jgi:hypothetical protein